MFIEAQRLLQAQVWMSWLGHIKRLMGKREKGESDASFVNKEESE